MPKVKQVGMEFSYTDSHYYEWVVEFDDATIISRFNADGSERMWKDVLDYAVTHDIKSLGVQVFPQAKADVINSRQDHQEMVISSTRQEYSYNVPGPQKGKIPYLMRRKQRIGTETKTFYVFGIDTAGDTFYIISDQGQVQQGNIKLLQWI